jgi:oleate hydratase
MTDTRKAYFVGGGIGALAGAAFMIRDAGFHGADISIFETERKLGGSLDAGGSASSGYAMRGSRMMTTENFECTWDLFKSIPSLSGPGKSVFDETIEFSEKVKWNAKARLVDRNRAVADVSSMGFSMANRVELLRLSEATEERLENTRITDWLSADFFSTTFWHLWSTTFAFQPWHSALEFKRYMHRFIVSFSRIEKLSGVKHPVYNHYHSMVCPLETWLRKRGVRFLTDTTVTDFDLEEIDGKTTVLGIHLERCGMKEILPVRPDDPVFFQNASMTDASSWGSMTAPPDHLTKSDSCGWALWEKLAEGRPDFGNPHAFNSNVAESKWFSFTVTLTDPKFFQQIELFTGNAPGTGGIITLKDSSWLMSIVLYHQPHFLDQPDNVHVFWGYALHPDRVGDFVAKPMSDCNGREILRELCGHLNFEPEIFADGNCIPCRMPYITSQFMPRARRDRPLPVPETSRNLAFVSQFVELPKDTVFTIEYSIRAAQMAVYELMKVERAIPPVTPYDESFEVKLNALLKAFK